MPFPSAVHAPTMPSPGPAGPAPLEDSLLVAVPLPLLYPGFVSFIIHRPLFNSSLPLTLSSLRIWVFSINFSVKHSSRIPNLAATAFYWDTCPTSHSPSLFSTTLPHEYIHLKPSARRLFREVRKSIQEGCRAFSREGQAPRQWQACPTRSACVGIFPKKFILINSFWYSISFFINRTTNPCTCTNPLVPITWSYFFFSNSNLSVGRSSFVGSSSS